MKTLVTGATGFLGTALCRALEAQGDEIVRTSSRDHDLRRPEALDGFARVRFDRIFHLAAWTQAGDFCLRHPGEQWIINQRINTTVLAFAQAHQPGAKLIAIGTSCAYDPSLPHREEDYLVGTPTESLFTYAMTKRMLLVGQRALAKQFGLRWLHLVPSTLYGPGYHLDGRQMHFVFDLIRKVLLGKHRGEPVTLWGDGWQRRELVHVDDFVAAALRLAASVDDEVVNVGAGGDHAIRDFARLICEHVGYDPEAIRYDETRYVGARAKLLVTDRLRARLPGFAPRDLKDGLASTIDWFEREMLGRAGDRGA